MKIIVFFLLFFTHISFANEIFVSLKKNKVNVRYGPSFESDIKYVYKKINKNFKDSFVEKGSGFGSTYGFGLIPIRIDYLFVSPSINVDYFKIHDIYLSDHKPISVFLNI